MSLEWNDLNPTTWPGAVKRQLGRDFGPIGGELSEEEKRRKQLLEEQAAAAGGFADYGEGGFKSLGTAADDVRMMLQQHATGAQSFSGEQLRQGLGQQLSQQRSFAAGMGSPMAARTAANNMGRASYGMSGQAALAGIAERQAFAKALADATLQQRQQELQAALGSRQNALTGYGAGNPFTPTPSLSDKLLGAGAQIGSAIAGKK